MELRILGPTEVRHDGSAVTLRGAKPRQLLVLLAMRPNRPVPAEELIEELWDGEPPPSAATALRVHVGRLRQVLEPARNPSAPSGRLPAGPHGYLLRIEPDELDVQRFERLLVLAREADANGDASVAVPRLTEALDLWRGAALADARDLGATRGEIARLEELRVVAIEELAEIRLALGEHALVIDALGAAIKEHPLRERLTESLMHALYRSGRHAEALRAYADLAHRLDEELGLEPSARLRRLEEDVLLQRPTLDFVAPRSLTHLSAQRGWSSTRFIGRRNELRDLVELYAEAGTAPRRAALVVGPPGIGKTTLVEEFCARIRCQGAVPLVGFCDPNPAGDYQPVAEILRALVERLSETERHALPARLRLVLPELVDEQPEPAPTPRTQRARCAPPTVRRDRRHARAAGRVADRVGDREHALGRPPDPHALAPPPAPSQPRAPAARRDVARRRVDGRAGRARRAPRIARQHHGHPGRRLRRPGSASVDPGRGDAGDDAGDHQRVGRAPRHHRRQSVVSA